MLHILDAFSTKKGSPVLDRVAKRKISIHDYVLMKYQNGTF
jgi:hypothetical protein